MRHLLLLWLRCCLWSFNLRYSLWSGGFVAKGSIISKVSCGWSVVSFTSSSFRDNINIMSKLLTVSSLFRNTSWHWNHAIFVDWGVVSHAVCCEFDQVTLIILSFLISVFHFVLIPFFYEFVMLILAIGTFLFQMLF